MRFASSRYLMAAAVALGVFAFSAQAYAQMESVSGCQNCNGYTFQATLTPAGSGQYSLSYKITNVSGQAADPYSWSLTLFNSGSAITSDSGLSVTTSYNNTNYASGYSVNPGKSNNGNANCNGTLSNAICIQQSGLGPVPTLAQNQSVTFTFDITCTTCNLSSSWIFLSSGNCVANPSANCYAISSPGTAVPMPEASNLAMYSVTLMMFGVVFAWRRRDRGRQPPADLVGC